MGKLHCSVEEKVTIREPTIRGALRQLENASIMQIYPSLTSANIPAVAVK
jgi:hypothetical protein